MPAPLDAVLRLGVLASPVTAYAPARLAREMSARGCLAVPVDARSFAATGVGGAPRPAAGGSPLVLHGLAHVLSTDALPGLAALEALRSHLVHLNPAEACLRSADKFLTYLALTDAGVPTPATRACLTDAALLAAGDAYGWPFVVKQPDGSGGRHVALVGSPSDLRRRLPDLRRRGTRLLAQEYVASAHGTDLRVVVVGGQVVASGRRVAAAGEFRSNLAQGGRGVRATPDAREAEVAVRAAAAVGLDIAGVDVLAGADGPLVVETNSFPGLEAIESLTGVNVAGAMVDLLLARLGNGSAQQGRTLTARNCPEPVAP